MFTSDRLIFKKLNENHFKEYYELYSNTDVMRFAYLDAIQNLEEGKLRFSKTLESFDRNLSTQYLVFTKESKEFIGISDYDVLNKNNDSEIYEIGYFLFPAFWRKGYATEMSICLIKHIFTNCNVHRIEARCNSNNKGSEKIMKKLGMKKEGVIRKVRYKNGQWDDEIIYGLLREEWEKIELK